MRVHMCTVLPDMRWPASRGALAPLTAVSDDWTPSYHITWRAGAGEIHQALEVNKHEALQNSKCDQQFSHTALALRLHNLDMHWQFPSWQHYPWTDFWNQCPPGTSSRALSLLP